MHKIFDSIHGFIKFDEIESELIESLPFQRLRNIHQLGAAYFIYPGATHTRFEHSIGVMHLSTEIFDRIVSKGSFCTINNFNYVYWRKILRVAALCHDLGHLPFSHAAEHLVLGKEGHEKKTLEIIQSSYLKPVWEKISLEFPHHEVEKDIIKISIGEKKLQDLNLSYFFSPWERVLCDIITSDFFGADRIDYLIRDSRCTGLSYGFFDYDQIIERLQILKFQEEGEGSFKLGLEESGLESCEALLLARYFMRRRLYLYPAVKSCTFHIARFIQEVFRAQDINDYLQVTDNEILALLNKAAISQELPGHLDAIRLLNKNLRFKALEFPINARHEGLLKKIKDKHLSEIYWDVEHEKTGPYLSFPVLTRMHKIVEAEALSQISLPKESGKIWVFTAPSLESEILKSLEI